MDTKTLSQVIDEFTENNRATIDEIAEHVLESEVLGSGFAGDAAFAAAKLLVRRNIKTIIDPETGIPKYHSVAIGGEDGVIVHLYAQERLLDVEEYRQLVEYHATKGVYHLTIAKKLASRCLERHHVQLPLPSFNGSANGHKAQFALPSALSSALSSTLKPASIG